MFDSPLPAERRARWALLDASLDRWFGVARASTGIDAEEIARAEQRLGISLPAAFREWYGRYGARQDVWSLQDTLWMPDAWRVERGVLMFAIENQDVVRWGTRLEDIGAVDPPVVVSAPEGGMRWVVESPTMSAFALQFAIMNAKWSGAVRYRANGGGSDEAFAAIENRYPRLPFADMHWPAYPTRFYGHDDLIVETHGQTWIWATARSRRSLVEVDALVHETGMATWESYDD